APRSASVTLRSKPASAPFAPASFAVGTGDETLPLTMVKESTVDTLLSVTAASKLSRPGLKSPTTSETRSATTPKPSRTVTSAAVAVAIGRERITSPFGFTHKTPVTELSAAIDARVGDDAVP